MTVFFHYPRVISTAKWNRAAKQWDCSEFECVQRQMAADLNALQEGGDENVG